MICTVKRRFIQKGFTLVELMIALVLGLIVIGGSLALFVSQRVTSGLTAQMSDVQAEGRIALDAFARDLRSAGDFGCWPVQNPITKRLNNDTAFSLDAGGVVGFGNSASLPSTGLYGLDVIKTLTFVDNSSVVAVTGINGSLSGLSGAMKNQSDDLVLKKPTQSFKPSDVAIITDCINWAKFQVTDVATDDGAKTETLKHAAAASNDGTYGGGNKNEKLGEVFKTGATVGRLDTVWWFVRAVNGQTGLYRFSARDSAPVLVSNRIQSIELLYDLDTNADGVIDLKDQAASAVSNWTQVQSATVKMLVRSDKIGAAGEQTVTSFAGHDVPQDKHLYLPLQMTIALRNQ